MNPDKISKIIKEIRNNNNLTQKELADKLNVTFQAVSKWENAKSIPDIAILKQISKEFNVSIDSLLEGDYSKKSKVKKYVFLFIGIAAIILGLLGLNWYLNKDNNAELIKLTTDCNDFTMIGMLTNNGRKSAIYISDINYCGKKIDEVFEKIECKLFEKIGNESREIGHYEEEGNKTLDEYLKGITINVSNYTRICKEFSDDSLYIEIYLKNGYKTTTYTLPVNVEDGC